MPMKKLLFVILVLGGSFLPISGSSQVQDSLIASIGFYADVMVNADYDEHRMKAYAIFKNNLQSFLASPESYSVSLDSIPWISVLHAETFRLITWQLRKTNEEYTYGGYIQWPDRLVELKDTRPWVNGSLRNTYSPGTWYGALYYKLMPFQCGQETAYILFGFNAENSLINTKVVDVLDLSGSEPKFGMPVFIKKEEQQTRIMLTYADASSVQLFYDPELNAIVHDHLESLPGVGPNGEIVAVSDGSQEGWFLKDDKWIYQETVYDIKSEVPPMSDERKDRKEDKDLFGRPKRE